MRDQLRDSGIDVIGYIPWGTHFCQFYYSKKDLVDVLVPYFKAGLENNEFCMWVTSEPLTTVEAKRAIAKVVPDFAGYLNKGQIEIIPHTRWYLLGDRFDADRVLKGWVDKLEKALAKGFSGMRLTGNTFWLERNGWDEFTDYEAVINDVIGKYKMVALCTYSLDKCDGAAVVDVVKNHQFALIKQKGKWQRIESTIYKQAKKALKESQEQFHQLYLSMTEGVAIHEVVYDRRRRPVDYIITDVNPAFESITGLGKERASGSKASELYGTGEAPYLDIYAKVAESGEPASFETYFLPMKKHLSISVFSPEKGKFATVFSDITGRKEAEKALRDSQHDLNRAQAVAKTGSWRLDTRRDELLWSDETYRMFGIPQGTPLTYEAFLANLLPADRDYVDRSWRAALRGEPYDIEHRIMAGKEVKWVREKAELEFDGQGQLLGGFGTVQDITERKEAEEKIKRIAEEWTATFDSIADLVSIQGTDYKLVRVNKAYADALGMKPEELVGKRCYEMVHGTSCPVDDCPHKQTLDTKKNATKELFEPRLGIYLEVSTSPVFDERGELAGSVHIAKDITGRKEAEEALQRKTDELARSNAELEQFAYVASHDLQEPLRMVSSYVQLLSDRYKGKLDKDADEFIGYAYDGALRMQRLINDLLSYSRVGTRGKPFGRFSLDTALEQALENLKLAIHDNGAIITRDPLPVVRGDDLQLVQVFQNLIDNGIKFHGDAQPKVHISARVKGNECVCSVRDNGIGIAAEYLNKVFRIFQRLHTRREYPGTGIGLAICKRIVERHGGKIWVESKPGEGSTFYFTIPVVKER